MKQEELIYKDFTRCIDPDYKGDLNELEFTLESFIVKKGNVEAFTNKQILTGINELNRCLNLIIQSGLVVINTYRDQPVSLEVSVDCKFLRIDSFVQFGRSGYDNQFKKELFRKQLDMYDFKFETEEKSSPASINSLDYLREWQNDMLNSLGYLPDDEPNIDPDNMYL